MKTTITTAQAMSHPDVALTINTLGTMADELREERDEYREKYNSTYSALDDCARLHNSLADERNAYAAAADAMAAAHKVERDALKDAARLALVALNGVVDFDPDARAQWSVSGGSIEAHECNAAITALKVVL